MTVPIISRFAGKALGDFFKTVSGTLTQGGEQIAANIIRGARTPQEIFKLKNAVQGPLPYGGQTVANIAGSVVPVGAAALLGLGAKSLGLGGSSDKDKAFSAQQYQPGTSPLTNAYAAAMMVEDRRFQQQLQLIRAREMAHAGSGSLGSSLMSSNPSEKLQEIFSSTYSY